MTTSYLPPVPPSDPGPGAPVRLTARRPADLLAAVPFLLGFHPEESLVALLLQAGRVLLTARYDLGDHAEAGVADLVEQHAPSGVVLVAYCADAVRGRAALQEEVDRLDRSALDAGVELVDVLLVDGRRWWSLACTSGCCPSEGSPYEPGEHPLSAEAVWAGLVARPDRAAVVATVAGPAEEDWPDLRRRVRRIAAGLDRRTRTDRQDALGRAVVAALPRLDAADGARAAGPGDDACLELALLVRDTLVRDVACALVTREDARRHLALWQEVLARTPPELAAAPLCLVGVSAWAGGNGTLLNACCERLGELDPTYPMGRLLTDVSRRALPPAWWDALADGLRRDLGLQG
ncbi:hypothetical protein GCM10022197_40370 [Microlunatus spumicola]|uniref:DUF4192 domain-containing protein n=1 Tax=Microlunatus spumicola TaxID=81499 RepID=A0ABP6YB22_9ACTN